MQRVPDSIHPGRFDEIRIRRDLTLAVFGYAFPVPFPGAGWEMDLVWVGLVLVLVLVLDFPPREIFQFLAFIYLLHLFPLQVERESRFV
ncbi:hypothetical protein ASPBRDRAFT_516806 [Aspergillus brasiliensis CBS 101740]|uniref:Uncharacterized protein n=1 Tax=Aspergillus brasiliensis (strain CBS 101740 / IMI 381727 / IBT 21946) TaxID=767769 RepID=A0A1L9UQ14_ASPBC|nr:hypothetical protein ASPBRDRAFT_516806 [Aspergillus brasiliensis CBS 101740]